MSSLPPRTSKTSTGSRGPAGRFAHGSAPPWPVDVVLLPDPPPPVAAEDEADVAPPVPAAVVLVEPALAAVVVASSSPPQAAHTRPAAKIQEARIGVVLRGHPTRLAATDERFTDRAGASCPRPR